MASIKSRVRPSGRTDSKEWGESLYWWELATGIASTLRIYHVYPKL